MNKKMYEKFVSYIQKAGYKNADKILHDILKNLKSNSTYLYLKEMPCYMESCEKPEATVSFELNKN